MAGNGVRAGGMDQFADLLAVVSLRHGVLGDGVGGKAQHHVKHSLQPQGLRVVLVRAPQAAACIAGAGLSLTLPLLVARFAGRS